ncbi:MAG TPA: NAD(P)/FAD-dependent oxidoreductase [Candidatus Saccharimonadales bacterium]|nr:NAD(P)/FAD-dependent oxidoreductase [Candidatus Saccharimonadales bacterium]
MIEDYNVIIVGGGPAGISAGIYAKYDGNNPLIIEEKTLAWIPEKHVNLLEKLEGFPALLNTVNGTQLVDRFRFSLSEMGVEYIEGVRVEKVTPGDGEIIVETTNGTYKTRAVIVATGTVPITLDTKLVNGHKKEVYYFAYNNFKDYIGKEVAVLGSRNSGSTAAIYLAKRGLKVTIFEIKDTVQAKYKHTQHFEPLGIKTITSAKVKRLEGSQSLERLVYEKDGQDQTIDCRAVFCYIGVRPLLDIANDLKLPLNEQGYVDTNFYQTSPTPGLFVAGDMCGDLKHIIAACGQGAKAAYNVNKYFSAHK